MSKGSNAKRNCALRRNLAVGHFYNAPFVESCAPYLGRISEVFFAWIGVLSCRPSPEFTPEVEERLRSDLHWCRDNGIRLDTLFNCNCYGDIAISQELADLVIERIGQMDRAGLMPDVVTTTSPFIATIIRKQFPTMRIRASVNMRCHGTIGFDAVSDLFDEFYISRERQRDLGYVRKLSQWASEHGKVLGMQVNSGCIRDCPFQTFHDNLHGHNRLRQSEVGKNFNFEALRCRTHYRCGNAREDILKATWIRPEDVPLWEEYISIFKLATRRIANPAAIVKAYAQYDYDGNLLDLLDPVHSALFAPYIIANKRFPAGWATSGIGGMCAMECTNCGRCTDVFQQVCIEDTNNKGI